jgi:ribosomal protein L37E
MQNCKKCGYQLTKSDVKKGTAGDWAKAGAGLAAATILTGGLATIGGLAYAGKKALDTTQVKVKCQNCGKVHYMSKEEYNNLK